MERNNMIKYAVRDMIENNPDRLAERLSVILSIDDCSRLCNGFVFGVEVRNLYAFAKKYNIPDGKEIVIDNIEVRDDMFTVCCTINNDEDGKKSTTKRRITESFDGVDTDVYYIDRLQLNSQTPEHCV